MRTITQGWNFMRIIRLGLGVAILVQGIVTRDILTIILGVAFGGMAIANIGCCGTNGCAINTRSTDKNKDISHEELDNKK